MNINTRNWFGTVTNENIEDVANAILSILKGKNYTWTESYEYRGFRPETRVHQHLENGTGGSPMNVWHSKEINYSGANFCDTYGVWGIYPKCYVAFEHDRVINIEMTTGAGKKAFWQITLED